MLLVSYAGAVAALAVLPPPLQAALGVVVLVVAPAAAARRLLAVADPLLGVVLGLASALAVLVLLSTMLLYVGHSSTTNVLVGTTLVTIDLLFAHAWRASR